MPSGAAAPNPSKVLLDDACDAFLRQVADRALGTSSAISGGWIRKFGGARPMRSGQCCLCAARRGSRPSAGAGGAAVE
jgi:hypothetical protein